MKLSYILTISLFTILFFNFSGFAQSTSDRDLQFYRFPDKRGVNVFETSKADTVKFDGLKVRIGGASTLQFQGLNHSNNAAFMDDGTGKNINQLIDLSHNFNLATANLDFDVQLEQGVRMHLRTYLSSRHHHETYVKGGYFQIDKLDFISDGFLDNIMNVVTIKIGHMENNFGDAHFRRTDNAMSIFNPFVGNYILDAFTTEVGAEVYLKKGDIIAMIGLSNGKLNQSVNDEGATGAAFLGKLGFDKQFNKNLRVRLTGSIYTNSKASRVYLYSGDRAGSRYYSVIEGITSTADNFTSGRWNPNFADKITDIMINSLIKYNGFELFGTYERPEGGDFVGASEKRAWNQFAIDAIYRFGMEEKVYAGIRYNTASGKLANSAPSKVTINRFQAGLGWFMTD
ncbi:MAG: hypothetical protein ABI550_06400, partial [Ignavibacteriaceae bacterium]